MNMPLVKKLVYIYALDEVLQNVARSDMPADFITQDTVDSAPNLQIFLNEIIQPIRNRIPHFPLSRGEVTKNPFSVLAMMNYILQFYEQVNIQLQQPIQTQEPQEQLSEQSVQPIQTPEPQEQLPVQAVRTVQLVRPREQIRRPQQPRLFALFPNPSLKWRFIKVDGENLSTLFPDTRLPKEENETNFAFSMRRFYNSFNFMKLGIRR